MVDCLFAPVLSVADILQVRAIPVCGIPDVEDEDTLKAVEVEAAVRESTSVKRIEVTIERVGSKNIISLSSSPGCC